MKRFWVIVVLLLLLAISSTPVSTQSDEATAEPAADDVVTLDLLWYADGNEDVVLRELLNRFEMDNPDIRVVVQTIPYPEILADLPGMLAEGDSPDMARTTSLGELSPYFLDLRPYLPDTEYWEGRFGETLAWLRPEGDTDGIFGYMTQLTVTGPFINRTLFQEAGVEVPSDRAFSVTWEEWAEAAELVAERTDTPIAMAMDRSGHRFAGPAISMGARIFDSEGDLNVEDGGFRAMAELLVGWHEAGLMPMDMWSQEGEYVDAADEFAAGDVVFYMSGSWQIQTFSDTIGDRFDWEAVPNPCGATACTGMPGGSAVVGFADTEHPAEVARVMDYLVSTDVLAEYSGRTLTIPAHLGLAVTGLSYDTDLPQAQRALGIFLGQVSTIDTTAFRLQGYQHARIFNRVTSDRLTQVINGEISLDEAISAMQAEIEAEVAAASAE